MKPPQSRARKNLSFALRVAGLLAKGFGLVFVVLSLLAAGGYWWLSRSMDAGRARALLEAKLSEALRRPAHIQGVVLTPQGIKLHGVRIEERADPAKLMLESDIALVTVKIAPLFRRRLELKRVRLVSPKIRIARDSTGVWSIADLFASNRTAAPVPVGRFSLPLSLAAEDIVIERGVLTVDDRLRDRVIEVERFNLKIWSFVADAPFPYEASFDNTSRIRDLEHKASARLEGTAHLASFDWKEAFIRADDLSVEVDGSTFKGSATLTFVPRPGLEADLALPELAPPQWEKLTGHPGESVLPRGRLHGKMFFDGPGLWDVAEAHYEGAGLSLAAVGTVDWNQAEPEFKADLRLERPFALEKTAAFRPAVSRYALSGALEGTAKLSGWPGRLAAHEAELTGTGLTGTFKHWGVAGASAALSAKEDFGRASLKVSSAALTFVKLPFSDLSVSASLTGRDLKVDSLSALWEGARLRAKVRVLDLSAPKEVAVSGSLARMRWETAQELAANLTAAISSRTASGEDDGKPWLMTFKYRIPRKFPDTLGHIRIGDVEHKNFNFKDTDILWDIRGVDPSLKKVNGELRVGFGPGRVNDIQAVQASHKFLTIVFLPYIYMHKMNNLSVLSAATAYPKTLDFSRIEGQYGIRQGDVITRFSQVDSPQLKAYAEGSADFGKETVDMTILTRLTSYRAPLPEWWVDELGRPAIGFRVKGSLNTPDLEPRLHKLESDELEKALEKGKQSARERTQGIERAMVKLRGL